MVKKVKVKLKKLSEDAIIPKYQTKGSAGFDFHIMEDITIFAKERLMISTGLAMTIPEGYELQIRPRSGVSAKTGIRIRNAPGTVDSDFSNEIKVLVENIDDVSYTFYAGDRIAQGVVAPFVQAVFEEVDELEETERKGGFGSTDKIK